MPENYYRAMIKLIYETQCYMNVVGDKLQSLEFSNNFLTQIVEEELPNITFDTKDPINKNRRIKVTNMGDKINELIQFDKYNLPVGGHADNQAIEDDLLHVYNAAGEITDPADFTYYAALDGYDWVSVFGVSNFDYPKPEGATLRWDDDDELANCNVCPDSLTIGRREWKKLFPGGPVGSPFQDGHYVYQVVAGSGSGSKAVSPILYLADIENPSQFHVVLQP